MDVSIIGGNGFVGTGISLAAKERDITPDIIDRNTDLSTVNRTPAVLINANGNSKKYLATQDPELDYKLSVESVQQSLSSFSPNLYVYLSTVDVYDHLTSPEGNTEDQTIDLDKVSVYGRHKLQAEALVQEQAENWLILRMAGFIGPGLWKNPIYDILTNSPLYVHPDSEFQYLHTVELGRIILDLIQRGCRNEVINVAGNGLANLHQVADWADTRCNLQGDPQAVRYEINIDKLLSLRDVPKTRDTLMAFVQDVREGRLPLT